MNAKFLPTTHFEPAKFPLILERLQSESDFFKIWEEWEQLDLSIEPKTPFTSPIWSTLWWKHFAHQGLMAKDQFFVHVVRDQAGSLRAVVPWMITLRPAVGPFRLRILRYFGTDQGLTEIRGAICRREDEKEVLSALHAYLQSHASLWDVIEWSGIQTSEGRAVLEADQTLSFSEIAPLFILPLTETWEQLNRKLSSSTRKVFRRAYEKNVEHDYQAKMHKLVDPDDINSAMERFFRLHTIRADTSDMFRHPNRFSSPAAREFMLECFTRLAALGRVGLFELSVNGRVVACRLCFLLGRSVYTYYSGYDPEWRTFSVGTVMMVELAKWAISNKLSYVNLSVGRDHSKMRWRPEELLYETGIQITSGSGRGRATSAYRAFRWLRTKAVANLRSAVR